MIAVAIQLEKMQYITETPFNYERIYLQNVQQNRRMTTFKCFRSKIIFRI